MCNSTGLCKCDAGFASDNCSVCAADHYSYPSCTCTSPIIYFCISNCFFAVCSSEKTCNGNGECDDSGSCECDKGFDGADCSSCSGAGFTYPECSCMNLFIISLLNINLWTDCEDDGDCYGNGVCHNGKCNCDTGFSSSSNCHSCASDYYNYPHCNCMLILYLNARN